MVETAFPRIGFLGAGRMATALAKGMLEAGLISADQMIASDVVPAARDAFRVATAADTTDDNKVVFQDAEVIIVAVKPQSLSAALDDARPLITSDHLIVSIAAGIPLKTYEALLGQSVRVIRVMPNTPCLVGAGASAFALGSRATEADAELVSRLLRTVGIAYQLPEHQLDAVTGLSGSGPAYIYEIIEAISDGGVRVGLPRDVATRLAAQTVLGAAQMVLTTGAHPGVLKDAVTSPGGTTIVGLHVLEQAGLRGCLMNAVVAATERSRELGQSL